MWVSRQHIFFKALNVVDSVALSNLITFTSLVFHSQWHRDGCIWSNRWIIQTTRIQVVHFCNRRRHDADIGPSARPYRGHHTSTDNFSHSFLNR